MKKIINHITTIVAITLLLILACSVLKYFDNVFNTEILDFIQALAGLFLFLFGLPVSLYRYNTNKRRKIMAKVSKD